MVVAYIGLGSNLDDPQSHVQRAFDDLQQLPQSRISGRSSLYITAPVGPQSQPDFVNAVCEIDTTLAAHGLLKHLQAIEKVHGRVREGERWGPRTLDLDLLLYGNDSIDTEELTVPHAQLPFRCFVLKPLHELAPALVVPGLGPVKDLLGAVDCSGVQKAEND